MLDASAFEVLAGGERIGPRRRLAASDVALLQSLTARYVQAVRSRSNAEVFVDLGRELYRWLDGESGQLAGLLAVATAPLVFEVQAPARPSEPAWSVLRAPFELLADPAGGFLAADVLLRFGVARRLGVPTAPPEPDGYRLGLAFMASSPRGQVELDFEAEEAAILTAVGDARLDLVVDDTGDPEQLGRRLADLGGLPVVHLSCHGTNQWQRRPDDPAVPVLMMEDEVGEDRPTTAADLVRLLTRRPRMVFVSACLTAAGADASGHLPPGPGERRDLVLEDDRPAAAPDGDAGGGHGVAHSLATGLVSAGVPAVLGWDGSVDDRAATVFAQHLYGQLGNHADLAEAVADARRVLLESDHAVMRRDWHLARLWLGPTGGGPLAGGIRKRSLVPANHATKTFLDVKHQHVPVAAASMFVGRRHELQRSLRALRSGDRAGVLLQGQGRLGKSSLAARIADRCPDRAVAVVFGDYSALAILDAIETAVRANPAAREVIERGRDEVRRRPEAIETVLIDLLNGPCAQSGKQERPLLLVIDDLEQILVPDASGPHRVAGEYAGVLAAVLRAFSPAESDSRLLLTSRFTFTLDRLERRLELVQLQPLSPVAQHKLLRRQQGLTSPELVSERGAMAERAVQVSHGNPGLQDLIGLRLVYGKQVDTDRAEDVLTGMEAYLQRGDLPSDAEVRAFLENLALDALVEQAGPAHIELLRAATVFAMPVPEPVAIVLADAVGGSLARLRGLGLLDSFPDIFDPAREAVAVNALAAGRIGTLDHGEERTLAALSVGPLFAAWGGPSSGRRREAVLSLQLTRLAVLGDTPAVAAACAADAVRVLRQGPAVDAFALGRAAVELLDRHHTPVPRELLRTTADAALTSGDGPAGEVLLQRAILQTDTDQLGHARVLGEYARLLVTRGELDQANDRFQQAHQLFTDAGSPQEAAAAMGDIADIAYQRGDYDEAFRIRREIELPVYERLGDTRSIAVAWGRIANIAYQRGDYDEALRIRHEVQLPVYERLGDTRATAITWSNIADIAYRRGDYDEALRIRREIELPVYERLGDTRSAAVTWGNIADIAYQRGDYDEALRIRREIELPVYERLGDTRLATIAWGDIADIAYRRGDYDEALRIRREIALPVFERLGDTRESAAAWGRIADIAYQRGDYDEALRIRREIALPVFERLGDTGETADTWGKIADILFERGDYDEASRLQQQRLEVMQQLGDLDGLANVTWNLAQIDLARQDYQTAAPRLVEAFQILIQLQRPDGLAVVGNVLGQLLLANRQTDDARYVLQISLQAATKVGLADLREHLTTLLDSLPGEDTDT
ncbi:tetratricopeptide repeat protein [Dactylosporangium sp. NBC_01737]|uniref:tetratricopeptide repeat protein n=1 Tax=Dactylosporangium sp. NBC_01737 TaxID=2975959 RepID=UPI002E150475|nr:tetratricopeptide repeat protein [Dactylosporangium sp. NBC_01737]